jgi:transcriptional regulator with XRE-family HTH domain
MQGERTGGAGTSLGEYLRARRELVTPEEAGLPIVGARRVPGLRREEVAMLAGMSADYYTRLEQGRERNPSPQVLASLARVLRLDDAATDYLMGLVAPRSARSAPRVQREYVPTGIAKLLATLQLPAFVEGRYFDVLASNSLAVALSPQLAAGENRLRSVFLDPDERSLYVDWDAATANLVAGFRLSVGTATNDPRFVKLVGELSLASERFRRLWARHDVQSREGGAIVLDHPTVGHLRLNREKLPIDGGSGGLTLAIYHADLGSDDAQKLALLASYALPPQPKAPLPELLRDPSEP